jgi:SHS family lactate transporter-like MFS transporter
MTGHQWRAFIAAFLGWMLDAFDYFLLVMVVKDVAAEYHASITRTSFAFFLTLAMRPVGARRFGYIADRWGRRPALMGSILLYAFVELLSGFAPTLGIFLVLRAIFGIGMGGEWGVGASLAMESVPTSKRGLLSGILQEGYPTGYLLAAVTYGLVFPHFGWRAMFVIGALPSVLVLFIQKGVRESPAWLEERERRRASPTPHASGMGHALRTRWPLFLYMIALMAAFNAFSHGTQDLYPSAFLAKQRGLPQQTVSHIAIIYCLGAIAGGVLFGAISQRIGRRRAIIAGALLSLPMIPIWIGSTSVAGLAVGAFLMQFAVQGAWGVVPAHLNELSPAAVRGTFPGLAYQLGNFAAAGIVTLQAYVADLRGGDYSFSLGWVVGVGAIVLATLAFVGPEDRETNLAPCPS